MSKTFTPRHAVRANARAASNNRQTPLARHSIDNSTQTNRGRGITLAAERGRGRAAVEASGRVGRGTTPAAAGGRGTNPTTRGRGANLVSTARVSHKRNSMDDFQQSNLGAQSSPQKSGPEQELGNQQGQYNGGFTKFEPNTKKRQQVSEMARKETEEYERYKQQNAMKYCNYVGTTGGGELTEDMVRRRQANDVRNQKFNRLQNQQKRREEMRDAEQREIDLKRAEARRKADENANHNRAVRPEDIRRKREDFLRQLESQSKTTNTTTQATNSLENLSISSPGSKSKPKTKPHSPPSNHQNVDRFSSPQRDSTQEWECDGEVRDEKKFEVEDFPEDVMTLAAMFPDIDMTYLNSLYKDAGSVDAVLDVIGV